MYKMRNIINILILIPLVISLNNCSSSMSLSTFMDYFNYSKASVDVFSYSTTDKTTTDHALSYFFGKDCSMARTIKLKAICQEIKKDNGYQNKYLSENKIKRRIKSKNIYQKKKIIKVPSMAYDIK